MRVNFAIYFAVVCQAYVIHHDRVSLSNSKITKNGTTGYLNSLGLEIGEVDSKYLIARSPMLPIYRSGGGSRRKQDDSESEPEPEPKNKGKEKQNQENQGDDGEGTSQTSDSQAREQEYRQYIEVTNPQHPKSYPGLLTMDDDQKMRLSPWEASVERGSNIRSLMRNTADKPQTVMGEPQRMTENSRYYSVYDQSNQPDLWGSRMSEAVPTEVALKLFNQKTNSAPIQNGDFMHHAISDAYNSRIRIGNIHSSARHKVIIAKYFMEKDPRIFTKPNDAIFPHDFLYSFWRREITRSSGAANMRDLEYIILDRYTSHGDTTMTHKSRKHRNGVIGIIARKLNINLDDVRNPYGGTSRQTFVQIDLKRDTLDATKNDAFDVALSIPQVKLIERLLVQRREEFDFRQITEINIVVGRKGKAHDPDTPDRPYMVFDSSINLTIGPSPWSQHP